jgi:hypothetical protein
VIEANPEITITGCIFAISTGIDSGYNVRLNGTYHSLLEIHSTLWRF